jgi:hypothetical protein
VYIEEVRENKPARPEPKRPGDLTMTHATLTAFRGLAAQMATAPRSMTAREMALIPHRLNRKGDKATVTANGQAWYWSPASSIWVR